MSHESRCSCVDIHTHVVPETFPPYLGKHVDARWPSTVQADACHRHVMLAGKVYRTVPRAAWDVRERVAAMDHQRMARQVLSPMPELLSYWLDPHDAAVMSRYLNEQIAQMVAADPDRFLGLGAVPLQDVERAIAELEYLRHELGLSGVEIGTNVNGKPVGDPMFEPFFAAAERLGAAIFVHPLRPSGQDRLVGPAGLEQLIAFPGETGLAAASILTSGVLARHPGLRIAFSHGGGTLSAVLPRLEHGWRTFPAVREAVAESPTAGARRMFYDSLVYDAAALRRLVECFGDTQVCVGSDYPFKISDPEPVKAVEALSLDAIPRERLLHENALVWLGQKERNCDARKNQ